MRAHVFDMDGTLLLGTSAPLLMAEALGAHESLHQLELRFASGDATAVDFARALHELWGVIDPAIARAAFEAAPLIDSIEAVLADIHGRDERACMITMSPAAFADHFLDFGFDAVFATRLPTEMGIEVDEAEVLDPRSKPRLAEAFCEEHGLRLSDAVAYGDSMSDVYLFQEVGIRVSVNGDDHIAHLADVAIEGPDLMAAYRAARELIPT